MKKINSVIVVNLLLHCSVLLFGRVRFSTGVPKGAILAYTKEYVCEPHLAGPLTYKAISEVQGDAPVNWVDIFRYITPAHSAQGFIDIALNVDGTSASLPPGVTPYWYLRADKDDDKGGTQDMRVNCDGCEYELLDPKMKSSIKTPGEINVTGPGVYLKQDNYIVLRFAVPRKVYNNYNVYLGRGRIYPHPGYSSYSDRYRVNLYILPLTSGPYAAADLLDTPIKYELDILLSPKPFPKRYVQVNTPVTFDGGYSVDTSGAKITDYIWDFGDGTTGRGKNPVKIYTTTGTYTVRLLIINEYGQSSWTNGSGSPDISDAPLPLVITVIDAPVSKEVILKQNYPNPFEISKHKNTYIRFEIPKDSFVTVKIYSFLGELVKTVLNEYRPAGEWVVSWDGKNTSGEIVSSGIYFYQINSNNKKIVKRMIVIR